MLSLSLVFCSVILLTFPTTCQSFGEGEPKGEGKCEEVGDSPMYEVLRSTPKYEVLHTSSNDKCCLTGGRRQSSLQRIAQIAILWRQYYKI
jgi:hypothetical protein